MIPKLSGNTAPPAPAIARKAIRVPIPGASAAPIDPSRKSERLITSSRSFPCWSPSLPRMGVSTAALSRNTVSTHVAVTGVTSSSRCRVGSAGKTRVCWTANAVAAIVRTASVNP